MHNRNVFISALLIDVVYDSLYSYVWGIGPAPSDEGESRLFSKVKILRNSEAVASTLFLLGELSMMGFSVEEEEDRGKIGRGEGITDTYRPMISTDLIDLVKLFMASEYPVACEVIP